MGTNNFWTDKFEIWDSFVREDYIRNNVILPHLINYINSNHKKIHHLADIGCGTGYIPYRIISSAINIQTFNCLDIDEKVITFANQKYYNSKLEFIVHDLFKILPINNLDFIYSIFTLLEFKLTDELCYNIFNAIAYEGQLLIYIPDFLIDILKNINSYNTETYIDGCLSTKKIDKKTKIEYPFYMNRIEFIIHAFIKVGFSLNSLEILDFVDSNEKNRIFSLLFVKPPQKKSPALKNQGF